MPVIEPPPSTSSYVTEPLLISKKAVRARPLLDPPIVKRAIGDSFVKLHPRLMMKNPVMFVVEVGAAMTTLEVFKDLAMGANIGFTLQITIWLWFTVLFANFAEAMAEGRGKAQADTLRKTKTETMAKRLKNGKKYETVAATELRRGDVVLVEHGDIIPGDGDVIEGASSRTRSKFKSRRIPAKHFWTA